MTFANNIPLSLYIHMPWCVRKCPYCDFNSHQLKNDLPEEQYINTLLRDLENDLPMVANRKLISIFIGGGTPSLFSPDAIEKLLTEIQKKIPFEQNIEITLEANPGTVDQQRFIGFYQAGINRLSIGIQSFQADKLQKLGRIHNDESALNAVIAVKNAGFKQYNLDLMHGLPDQTLQDACHDLQTALDFIPPHLSWYQLTLEPNTLFHHRPPQLPDENTLIDIQDMGHNLIINKGYQHYEVSAYCQPGNECRHNINYWEFGDYLGIGAGAHSKITDTQNHIITRTWKIKHPQNYLNCADSFIGEISIINQQEISFEFMLNALRLQKPISKKLFEERTGLPISTIDTQLSLAQQKQLLKVDQNSFEPTQLGRRFLNDLIAIFMK